VAVNHLHRLELAILLVLVSLNVAQAQSADGQSLGDVARTQRQKKPAAKVIDDDEMSRRGLNQGLVNAPFDCDPDCVRHAKAGTSYGNGAYRNATEQQWQDSLAAAVADLAQGDWSQRLSEIREEVCRNPGDVDAKRLNALEDEMFTKLRLEARAKNIDDAAAAHPNDAAGVEALRQLRLEEMKQAILAGKVDMIEHSCPAPKAPGK
jgi:hypothetical protein